MPRAGNGAYQQPANTAAVSGQTIGSTAFNSLTVDIGSEITNSLDRAGRSAMSANLPMGGNKITGAADPTLVQDVATKNYVDTTTATFFSTGDVKLTLKAVADAGWRMFDDGTIGNVSSGATFANVAALALYTLIWNNIADTWAPVTGSRGANAAADWAAQKPIALPKVLGRALVAAGSGSGLSVRPLGATVGEEAHVLSIAELPVITPAGTVGFSLASATQAVLAGAGGGLGWAGGTNAVTNLANTFTGTPFGSGTAHNNMQPTAFLNVMIKL